MKRGSGVVVAAFFAALGAGVALSQSQSGYDLFQQALVKERTEGNVQEAIELYQRIVREFSGNRALAAKALVEMGQCYEKLGKEEARKAYERVLHDYADQNEAAAQARIRLAALTHTTGPANGSMVARRVWADPETVIWHTAISFDGRYYSHVAWGTGDLALRDLTTGQTRRLTDKGSWMESTEFALSSVFSPDDRQIAYTWFNKDFFYDLRIMAIAGSAPRVLYSNKEAGYIQPRAWSSDGRYILTTFTRDDGTNQIATISVADGSVRVLKSLDWRYPIQVSLSPDGRYVAYDFQPDQNSQNRDIRLLASDGSREIPLVENPANDLFPLWTPDGKHVVFNSDRSGSMSAWMIEVIDGKPQGPPLLVKSDMTRSMPLAFTRKGSFFYGVEIGGEDVYVADVDLATGKIAPAMKLSERYVGGNHAARWSPDGQYLAYVSTRAPMVTGDGWGSTVIVISSLKSGEERELPVPFERPQVVPRWSPDGRFFLEAGGLKNHWGLYKIAVDSGEINTILQFPASAYIQKAEWSADGKAIFYSLLDRSEKRTRLLRRTLDTGEEAELYRADAPRFIGGISPSPDGRHLAFWKSDPAAKSKSLMIVPAGGGQPRELLQSGEKEDVAVQRLTWTRDGREIVFLRLSGPRRDVGSVWLLSPEGGQPRSLGPKLDGINQATGLSFDPDGRRLAFSAGSGRNELWTMENLLPVLKAAK